MPSEKVMRLSGLATLGSGSTSILAAAVSNIVRLPIGIAQDRR